MRTQTYIYIYQSIAGLYWTPLLSYAPLADPGSFQSQKGFCSRIIRWVRVARDLSLRLPIIDVAKYSMTKLSLAITTALSYRAILMKVIHRHMITHAHILRTWKPCSAKLTSLGRLVSRAICSGCRHARRNSYDGRRALLSCTESNSTIRGSGSCEETTVQWLERSETKNNLLWHTKRLDWHTDRQTQKVAS